MSPSDQYNIFHPVNPHSEQPDPGEPGVDVLNHPLAKISERNGVLASGFRWKI